MSSAAEGWYVDPSTGTNMRLWNGTTWTDEVAPLPDEAPPVDLFAARDTEAAADPATGTDEVNPPLEPELERTFLTRRELRARRGRDPNLDDSPKHLPPMIPPAANRVNHLQEPEEVDIPAPEHPQPAPPLLQQSPPETGDAGRHVRIVRLSVLLGVLAVVSGVAVLTGGML